MNKCKNCFYWNQEFRPEYGYIEVCGVSDRVTNNDYSCNSFKLSESEQIKKLEKALFELEGIASRNLQLITYFKEQESTNIDELDNCLDQIKEHDDYVNKHVVKRLNSSTQTTNK